MRRYRLFCLPPDHVDYGTGFYARMDSSGSLQSASYLGGSVGDTATAISIAPSGLVSIVGDTRSPDFRTTSGAVQKAINGLTNTLLMILNFLQ